MTETFVETQVRLVLERQCGDAFMEVLAPMCREGADMTLIMCDYGDKGNVAFKTSLSRLDLVRTAEALIERWRTGIVPLCPPDIELPDPETFMLLGDELKKRTPAGVGFAVIMGRGALTLYVATIAREDVIALLENEALPHWRADT
jgi:hypothetical protein